MIGSSPKEFEAQYGTLKFWNEIANKGELFWSKWMKELNTKFNPDNDRYEAVVGNISDADCEKLKSLGIKIKNKEGMSVSDESREDELRELVKKQCQEINFNSNTALKFLNFLLNENKHE